MLSLRAATIFGAAGEPCLYDTLPECILLNQLWNAGTAAGNNLAGYEDWYRNADKDHSHIIRAQFPQISDYGTGPFDLQKTIVDAPRIVIGNASLSPDGLSSIVRSLGMNSDFNTNLLYDQYRANQTYWYPSVEIRPDTVTASNIYARDLNTGMFPYANQSVGASGTERDEITKFFHTLAAFKPAVKTKLANEGLIIPALQMIYRRTRVDSDAEYLSGLAHPSAFDNVDNDVAMINMAQGIDTTNIPPMIQLVVEKETYGERKDFRYNDNKVTEQHFTTPAAIARVFRGPEYTKHMIINASTSIDANGLPLSYEFVLLRGDPDHVRITPLNASGSRVRIEIDYHTEAPDPNSNRIYNETANPKIHRLSNLVVIGAFVNNGSYYSAPGFITSFSLRNEIRNYDVNNLIKSITYTDEGTIGFDTLSRNRRWETDTYTHDFNQRMTGWTRNDSGTLSQYTAEGLLLTSIDAYGRPLTAQEVVYSYPVYGNLSAPIDVTPNSGDFTEVEYLNTSLATATDTALDDPTGAPGSFLDFYVQPAHGTIDIDNDTDPATVTYTPDAGFTGVDLFMVKEYNIATMTARLHKIRIAVGPTDTTAPVTPTGVTVYGASSSEVMIAWPHTTDNVEVYGYNIYRDGSLLGKSYTTTTFTDSTVTPGSTYNYTISAFDDAGNESLASAAVSGGSAALWGQDDFEDGDYTTADAALLNGLTWIVESGSAGITTQTNLLPVLNGKWMKVGSASPSATTIMPPATLPAPFLFEFHDAQQYAIDNMGLIFLYQDDNNFYSLEITRDVFALHRTMGGVKTTIGTAPALTMQHAWCSAKFSLQVVITGGAITFEVKKSEWTTYGTPVMISEGTQAVHWQDHDAVAVAAFIGGRIGFYQDNLNSWNVANYDNILISALAGDGPDTDANGLPDAYERAVFGDLGTADGAPENDYDGDFKDTLSEYHAGTDPKDATSLFELLSGGINSSSGDFELNWSSVAGKSYAVQFSSTLETNNWTAVTGLENEAATPPTNSAVFSTGGGTVEFYRVKVK